MFLCEKRVKAVVQGCLTQPDPARHVHAALVRLSFILQKHRTAGNSHPHNAHRRVLCIHVVGKLHTELSKVANDIC